MGDGDGMEDVNDGSVLVPLAGQTLPEPISRERVREIRMFEKKRDAAAARVSQQRDHGVFVLPPPPPGHEALPAGPGALGRRRLPPVEPAVLGAQPVNTVASGAQPVNPVALGAQSVNPVAPGAQPVQSAALGARSRRHVANYEPPKKRTMEDIRKDAAAKREAKETEKRKRGLENTEPPVSKKYEYYFFAPSMYGLTIIRQAQNKVRGMPAQPGLLSCVIQLALDFSHFFPMRLCRMYRMWICTSNMRRDLEEFYVCFTPAIMDQLDNDRICCLYLTPSRSGYSAQINILSRLRCRLSSIFIT
jgi:hypothetical protein